MIPAGRAARPERPFAVGRLRPGGAGLAQGVAGLQLPCPAPLSPVGSGFSTCESPAGVPLPAEPSGLGAWWALVGALMEGWGVGGPSLRPRPLPLPSPTPGAQPGSSSGPRHAGSVRLPGAPEAEGLGDLVSRPLLQVPERPQAVWPPSASHTRPGSRKDTGPRFAGGSVGWQGAPPSSSPQASACTGTWTRFCQRVPWKPEPSSPPGFSQTFTLTPECTAGGGPHLPAAHSGCTGTGRRGFEGSSGSRPVSLPRQAPRGALPAAVTCSSCPCSPSRQTGAW